MDTINRYLSDRGIISAHHEGKSIKEGSMDVLMFYPLPDETDLLPLYDSFKKSGHHVFFPVTHGDDMDFFEVQTTHDFIPGALKVMEPRDRTKPYVYGRRKTICLTPGTLFSERRQRRGRGKGYYDRFFSDKPEIFKIGVTTESRVVPEIATHPWDVAMDVVVTEERIIE